MTAGPTVTRSAPLRALLATVAVCAVSLLAPGVPEDALAASGKACGEAKVETDYGTIGGPVRASRITCRRARQVIRYALGHPEGNSYRGPEGWACARGGSPAVSAVALRCSRGRAWAALMNP